MTNDEAAQRNLLDDVLVDRQLSLGGLARLYQQAVAVDGLRSGADRNLIWKWKTGRRTPTQESQRYLADALGVSRSVIAEEGWPYWLRHAIDAGVSVLDAPWSFAGAMQVLHHLSGGPMDRRGFVVITGGALLELVTHWGNTIADLAPEAGPARIGQARLIPDLLARIGSRLADLRRLDDALGGIELRKLALAEFRWLTHLADQIECERRLFSLVAEAARLCGWLHFDAGHHAAAQAYYVAGLRCSAIANDTMTGAHILACMSFQAMLISHPQDAVALIEGAQQRLRHHTTPRLDALLASRKARAYAKAGDARACGRALNDAERSLEIAATDAGDPDWLYYFDEAELAAQAGACWVDLRRPTRARPLIDNALHGIDPNCVRDRTIYHVRSAEAWFQDNELEFACHQLGIAADLARHTGSVRSVQTIRVARQAMASYEDEAIIRELDDQLRALDVMTASP